MPGPIAKPMMRGLLEAWTKKHVSLLLIGSTLVGVGWHFAIGVPRKKAYADFYKVSG